MSQFIRYCMLLGILLMVLGVSACQPIVRPELADEDVTHGAHAEQESHPLHWAYSGTEGPDHWSELSEDFTACTTGHEQSPIDLSGEEAADLPDITFNYQPSALNILNNGHTIQVNYDPGSTIEVNGTTYELKQFHFHAHSEHTIDGKAYPLEMHLVHQSAAGQLAVVGVMAEAGAANDPLAAVWENMPTAADETVHVDTLINAADLLPSELTYYGYDGSLTTPPCSEGVKWHVLTTPIQLSTAQLDTMATLLHNNFRPVQDLYARDVTVDTISNSGR